MFIYSGDCRLCKTGLLTELKDDVGNELKTGDIVLSYTISKDLGCVSLANLTAVVANHYDNFHNLPPVECSEENKSEPFIMGIKNCDIQEPMKNYPITVWRIHRIKRFNEIVAGEKWDDYGFNYKEAE